MIFKVSNNEDDIEKLLFNLKETYGDYAFISYIDGEYGIRISCYNSVVYDFYKKMKENNIVCIGISFKGTTSFLDNLCDHIIEIDDIEFLSNTKEIIQDNSQHSLNHSNNVVSSNSYEGNDGWNLTYIRGIHCNKYENILLKLNFKNIFYTLHVDGSRFINCNGCNNGIIYKINDINMTVDLNVHYLIGRSITKSKIEINEKTNKIAIWIRNTNKWSHKNIPENVYKHLFNYCIDNNKTCYVFQDIIPVDLPINENIIDCTTRYKNRPDFDNFLKVCSTTDIFIGADSGATQVVAYSSINPIILCIGRLICPFHKNIYNINSCEEMEKIIKNYYQ